jgi:hypothetical protein
MRRRFESVAGLRFGDGVWVSAGRHREDGVRVQVSVPCAGDPEATHLLYFSPADARRAALALADARAASLYPVECFHRADCGIFVPAGQGPQLAVQLDRMAELCEQLDAAGPYVLQRVVAA